MALGMPSSLVKDCSKGQRLSAVESDLESLASACLAAPKRSLESKTASHEASLSLGHHDCRLLSCLGLDLLPS